MLLVYFPSFAWLSMTFSLLWLLDMFLKVNLNMIIFCMLEILPFKELWSPCKVKELHLSLFFISGFSKLEFCFLVYRRYRYLCSYLLKQLVQ